MTRSVVVVGHQNPDNDSICSAVAYAYLRNEVEGRRQVADPAYRPFAFEPARLGPLPPESVWVLESNGFSPPKTISHVYARVLDVMTPDPISITKGAALIDAGQTLRRNNLRSLVVTDEEGRYYGLITTRMIAERYIAATDVLAEDGSNSMAVAADLVASLAQKVCDITETDVLVLDKEGLLKEAVEDLMASSLREAVVLDDDQRCIGIVTRSDITTRPRRKVALVDHNETSQAVRGIEDAEVMAVIDHHRIGDVSTANPIHFVNLPVGSTATIVSMEFERNGVDMPARIAKVLLSAVLTDTVICKSPTTTQTDKDQVARLAAIAQVDPDEFALEVFACRSGGGDDPVDKLVGMDAKEFQIGDATVLIAQHETVDLAAVMAREGEIRAYMRTVLDEHGYEFVLFMVTDIMAEGSQFICEGNRRIVNRVFNINCTGVGGTWMPGILSRKKQVAPRILGS
ncbi:MAG: putative manganese-dependent inorganic diphosphatase [Coriobacteriaceae bacterium]|nr:putative manganese-dependent inorganic diphosphatase [Coriobacteriaceae bacterium]